MLAADIIRPSNSNWCSPAFLIKKKVDIPLLKAEAKKSPLVVTGEKNEMQPIVTTKSRLLVNHRGVNRRKIVSKFPLPDIVTLMTGLGNAKLICKFDITSAYFRYVRNIGTRQRLLLAQDLTNLTSYHLVALEDQRLFAF